jgi:acyl-coenzyme A synthetase/AMP-(fatty) acid ligase
MTFIEMLERDFKESPEKIAIIYQDSKISYKELNHMANKLANALIGMGLKKGDRIGFMLPRIPELIISFLSIAKAQGIAVPINFELLDDSIRKILTDILPRCLIVHENFLDLTKRSLPSGPKIPIIVVGEGTNGKEISWEEMLKSKRSLPPPLEVKEDDVVYLNYTSGSTGNPKGAITTHSNIYWNTLASVDALGLTSEDIHLCMFAPFAHPHEIFARPLYLGGTMVLVDKIFPKSIAETIAHHKVTCMMGLAPMFENLLEVLEHKTYDLSSLRIPESGGMYTRTELIERFRKKLGVPIIPVWGSTETAGIAIANRPDEQILPGSVGKPCTSYEVKIIDENEKILPPGEIGEMIFKGPAVVQGYYQDTINTQSCFKDGWYYSGDLGRRDKENNFYFIERKSGMMKVAGLKVYPSEIELALMEHPDIKEVAVISTKDKLRGEVPKVIIVTKNGKELTQKEIIEFCRERMPNYKVPRIVQLREVLPKSGSGKINKKELQMERI